MAAGVVAGATLLVPLVLFAAVAPLLPSNGLKTDATVLAALLLGVGGYLTWRAGARASRSVIDRPVLALLAVALLATIFSVDPFLSFFPSVRRGEGLVVFAIYLLMALAAARLPARLVPALVGAMLVAGTLIAVIAVAQYYGTDPAAWVGFTPVTQSQFYALPGSPAGSTPLFGPRSHGTLGNPIFLGGYVVLLLPLALVAALTTGRRWWLYGLAAIALWGGLIASQTRAAWGAAVVLGVVLLAGLRGAGLPRGRMAALALAFVAVTIAMALTQTKGLLSERALSSLRTNDAPLAERIYLWKSTLPLIGQRPLLGWGFSTLLGRFPDLGSAEYVRVYGWHAVGIDTPHNELLHVAYSIGLAGLAGYLWVWFTVIRTLRRGPRDQPLPYLSTALLAALAAYFLWLQLGWNHIGPAQVFWTLAGLGAGLGGRAAVTGDGGVA